jgi:hypothetical protein
VPVPPTDAGGPPDAGFPPLRVAQFLALEGAHGVAVDDGLGVALVARSLAGPTLPYRAAIVDIATRTVRHDLFSGATMGADDPPLVLPGRHLGGLIFPGGNSPDGYPLNHHIVSLLDGEEQHTLVGWTRANGIDTAGERLFTGVPPDRYKFRFRIYALSDGALLHDSPAIDVSWRFYNLFAATLVDASAGRAYVQVQDNSCPDDPSAQGILAIDLDTGELDELPLSLPRCVDSWLAQTPDGARLVLAYIDQEGSHLVQVDTGTGETLRTAQPAGFSVGHLRAAVPARDRLYTWQTFNAGPRGGQLLRSYRLSDLEPVGVYEVDTAAASAVTTDSYADSQQAPIAPYGSAGLIIVAHAAGGPGGGLFFIDGLD